MKYPLLFSWDTKNLIPKSRLILHEILTVELSSDEKE